MTWITFHGRQAARLENELLRVTVLQEGGHIAEIFDKRAGVSPLWIPHWTSMEPSQFDRQKPEQYGTGSEAKLLAGIMGHNLCLDLFGAPSEEEARQGQTVHGEGSISRYDITESPGELTLQLALPIAQLRFSRTIQLRNEQIKIQETVENLSGMDRPLAWTQHVTLGPAISRSGNNTSRSVNDALHGLGERPRCRCIPDPRGCVFMATCSPHGRQPSEPSPDERRRSSKHVHSAPRRPRTRGCLLRGFQPTLSSRLRLHLEAVRFSVARDLGGELQPARFTLGWSYHDSRNGVRCLADP